RARNRAFRAGDYRARPRCPPPGPDAGRHPPTAPCLRRAPPGRLPPRRTPAVVPRTGSEAARGWPAAVERSTLGQALAGFPDLLRRPLPCPGLRNPVEARLVGLLGRLDLDQIKHLEARLAEQPDPVAISEVELDARWFVRPLESVHAEVVPDEALGRR